jgi:hypothetical protein
VEEFVATIRFIGVERFVVAAKPADTPPPKPPGG